MRLVTENLQRAGSFKIRGAYNRIAQLRPDEKARGVVAASAGNHAQGVALAAQRLGVRATVFMPEAASIPKVAATRGYGAEVVLHGRTIDEALDAALAFSDKTGAVVIHPFDNADVVAGQGTLGLEILDKMPDVRTIVVCTGGGGLLAGVALAVKSIRPDVRVVGVQAQEAAAYPPSLAAGQPMRLPHMATMLPSHMTRSRSWSTSRRVDRSTARTSSPSSEARATGSASPCRVPVVPLPREETGVRERSVGIMMQIPTGSVLVVRLEGERRDDPHHHGR